MGRPPKPRVEPRSFLREEDGKKFYSTVSVKDSSSRSAKEHIFRIGHLVHCANPSPEELPHVNNTPPRDQSLASSRSPQPSCSSNNKCLPEPSEPSWTHGSAAQGIYMDPEEAEVMCLCRWLYRSPELRGLSVSEKSEIDDENELFLSDHYDKNEVLSISQRVLCRFGQRRGGKMKFVDFTELGAPSTRSYVCRYRYIPTSGKRSNLRPLTREDLSAIRPHGLVEREDGSFYFADGGDDKAAPKRKKRSGADVDSDVVAGGEESVGSSGRKLRAQSKKQPWKPNKQPKANGLEVDVSQGSGRLQNVTEHRSPADTTAVGPVFRRATRSSHGANVTHAASDSKHATTNDEDHLDPLTATRNMQNCRRRVTQRSNAQVLKEQGLPAISEQLPTPPLRQHRSAKTMSPAEQKQNLLTSQRPTKRLKRQSKIEQSKEASPLADADGKERLSMGSDTGLVAASAVLTASKKPVGGSKSRQGNRANDTALPSFASSKTAKTAASTNIRGARKAAPSSSSHRGKAVRIGGGTGLQSRVGSRYQACDLPECQPRLRALADYPSREDAEAEALRRESELAPFMTLVWLPPGENVLKQRNVDSKEKGREARSSQCKSDDDTDAPSWYDCTIQCVETIRRKLLVPGMWVSLPVHYLDKGARHGNALACVNAGNKESTNSRRSACVAKVLSVDDVQITLLPFGAPSSSAPMEPPYSQGFQDVHSSNAPSCMVIKGPGLQDALGQFRTFWSVETMLQKLMEHKYDVHAMLSEAVAKAQAEIKEAELRNDSGAATNALARHLFGGGDPRDGVENFESVLCWSDDERRRFVEGLLSHRDDFYDLSKTVVRTRGRAETTHHFYATSRLLGMNAARRDMVCSVCRIRDRTVSRLCCARLADDSCRTNVCKACEIEYFSQPGAFDAKYPNANWCCFDCKRKRHETPASSLGEAERTSGNGESAQPTPMANPASVGAMNPLPPSASGRPRRHASRGVAIAIEAAASGTEQTTSNYRPGSDNSKKASSHRRGTGLWSEVRDGRTEDELTRDANTFMHALWIDMGNETPGLCTAVLEKIESFRDNKISVEELTAFTEVFMRGKASLREAFRSFLPLPIVREMVV